MCSHGKATGVSTQTSVYPEACEGTLSGKLALSSDTQSTEPGPSPLISIGQSPNLDEKSFAQLVHFDAQIYSTDFSEEELSSVEAFSLLT